MSDYIYMLESHLSPEQNRVATEIQTAAGQAGVNLFLTGGAMRDMLAGFRIRGLDFVVEGNALKLAKSVCDHAGAKVTAADEHRKVADLVFPGGIAAQIAMSRQEKRPKPGGKPQVSAATIQEDLRGRDFTCNAIALSLNKASRGLLLDPMNGLADIGRRELRTVSPYGFYDDPSRLLRLIRFRVRLGFTVEERTLMQVGNAWEAGVEGFIAPASLGDELRRIAHEDNPSEVIRELAEAGLLALFAPPLGGPKFDLAALARFDKAVHELPLEERWQTARLGPFLQALGGGLAGKEQHTLAECSALSKAELDLWQKLPTRARKLETALRSARIKKPSQVYRLVSDAKPDEVLFVLAHSEYKPVLERVRNYFQKFLPAIQEITPEEWAVVEGKPGTPKYVKAREAFIAYCLDRKPKKPVEPEAEAEPAPPPPPEPEPVGRRGR